MYLSLTIVIDNHICSQLAMTVIISDEINETYQWILECLLRATNGLVPKILFTDANPAMTVAIYETIPSTKHNYCIWHIHKNLEKNLKGKLPVQKYFECALGVDVTGWALCYTHHFFNGRIQSTQHVNDLDDADFYKLYNLDYEDIINLTNDISFAKDEYESVISNLDSLIKYIDQFTIQKIWHVATIEQQKEHFVIICRNANHLCTWHLPNNNISIYEHQINSGFNFLNKIHHTQIFSETVKQNLSCQIKYNQGLGYAKKAVDLALETGYENELNKLLRDWINETERKMSYNLNESNNKNLSNITNPYLTRMKDASKKCLKSILENYVFKHHNQKTDEPTQRINKYTEDLGDNR
ncbi:9900_t:CDS:2 [Cetraspora pellucida]|uniref:9900_t:CDS:1 n=1 Tax=Cetraspora pellucida TaxID=1433469 RepID=A0A9N9CBF8_9GLOM|nr:9900_t:CDS:2 [Cetraspora pellucida]